MKLALQLKKILRERDLNVQQLSRATKISDKKIYSWLENNQPKNLNDLKVAAVFLDCSVDFLLFGDSKFDKKISITDFKEELNIGSYEIVLRKTKT